MRRSLGQFIFAFCGVLLWCTSAEAAPSFPALTSHVVDDAHILSRPTRDQLDQQLIAYETQTSTQLVVVTLASLEGMAIEEYSIELGRLWQIGQKDKNNGVLFVLAPNDHLMRIEVGYGLEGTLTDATSSEILRLVVTPPLVQKFYEKAVVDGTQAIMAALKGDDIPGLVGKPKPLGTPWQLGLIGFLVLGYIWLCFRHPNAAWLIFQVVINIATSGRGGGGSGGGGFSGGGGSFGGGGASGRW